MSEQSSPEQDAEAYFKKLDAFTKQQQEKVAKVIEDGAKVLNDFKPFTVSDDVDKQVEALIKNVDEQLTKAMDKVTEQMKKINEQVSS
ncbi:MAG: hypothetical protein HRT35_00490 [Algicola sp.]|nr:hypothetical protein [Algicola sp.]